MVKIYFHTNYPKDLTSAINLVHMLKFPQEYEIERTSIIDSISYDRSVFFLFDHAKRNIDLVTQSHYDSGYRIFAFKLLSTDKLDPFKLGLTLISLWPKILDEINKESDPFIFTYSYSGKKLKRIK